MKGYQGHVGHKELRDIHAELLRDGKHDFDVHTNASRYQKKNPSRVMSDHLRVCSRGGAHVTRLHPL